MKYLITAGWAVFIVTERRRDQGLGLFVINLLRGDYFNLI